LKIVIVTGASSGIGKAASSALVGAGYKVYGLARSFDKLQELTEVLENFVPVEFDITKPEKFDHILYPIISSGVYGLVNNAGYVEPGAIEDLSMESIRSQFETNFFGHVAVTKKVLPALMAQREGRIVNVSSMAGMVPVPLIAFTEALIELWDTGIKVATINPGVIETNIHSVTTQKVSRLANSRFLKAYERYLQKPTHGLPTTVVADAINDAISSSKPKYRYLLGSTREKIGVRLRRFAPDDLIHSLVANRIH
jgi:short-subunit dehydrogenase